MRHLTVNQPRPISNALDGRRRVHYSSTSPNDIARQPTGRDYVSYSAISTYQKCSLRYFFQYVADLAPKTVSASLLFGGAIHAAIEAYFNAILAGEPLPSSNELVAF
jgi:hypothetical protein